MSDDRGSLWPAVHAVLLLAVLAACVTVTCSNSRLEGRVRDLESQVKRASESGPAAGGGPAQVIHTVNHVFPGGVPMVPGVASPVPAAGQGTQVPPRVAPVTAGRAREPGATSGVRATGWGGRTAEVTFVEGAAPDAPLRIQDKPRPQNDWYVQRWSSPAKSYNPYTTNESECLQVTRGYILQGLMRVDPEEPPKVQGNLATRWEVSDDKLHYTYHLRRGVQFADGRPFTSADVKFSFDVMRDEEVAAAHMTPQFEDVIEVGTPDPYTFTVTYSRPYWKGLYAFGVSLLVLNKGWYEEEIPKVAKEQGIETFSTEPGKKGFGTVFRKMRLPCPGTGPYYLRDEKDLTQERAILVQNPFSWTMQVEPGWWNFTQMRRLYIKDPAAADEAFLKGEFDIMSVAHDRWEDQLSKDPRIAAIANHYLYDHTGIDTTYFCWNTRQPPFDDARVRVAMTHLLDREWIVAKLYRGNATVATCKSKRIYPTYSLDLVPHAFDIERAKTLLAEAGWKDTDGDGLLDRDGRKFSFVLKGPSSPDPFGDQVTGRFRDACRKAGVEVRWETSEWSTFIGDFEERRFQAAFLGSTWGDPFIDNYESYHSSQDVPKGGNSSGWNNPEADRLLEAMRVEFDEAERTKLFHRFNRVFYDEQPETLFAHPLVSVCMHKRFQGVKVRKAGMQWFDFWVEPKDVLHQ